MAPETFFMQEIIPNWAANNAPRPFSCGQNDQTYLPSTTRDLFRTGNNTKLDNRHGSETFFMQGKQADSKQDFPSKPFSARTRFKSSQAVSALKPSKSTENLSNPNRLWRNLFRISPGPISPSPDLEPHSAPPS